MKLVLGTPSIRLLCSLITALALAPQAAGSQDQADSVDPPDPRADRDSFAVELRARFADDREFILRGVDLKLLPRLAARVCVTGPYAFPILGDGGPVPVTLLGAGELGKGRVVAAGGHKLLGWESGSESHAVIEPGFSLLKRLIQWAAGEKPLNSIRVGLIPSSHDVRSHSLRQYIERLDDEAQAFEVISKVEDLRGLDIVYWFPGMSDTDSKWVAPVTDFVERGGGMITCMPWSFARGALALPVRLGFTPNRVLSEAGLWLDSRWAWIDDEANVWNGHGLIALENLAPLISDGDAEVSLHWAQDLICVERMLGAQRGPRGRFCGCPAGDPFVDEVKGVVGTFPREDRDLLFPSRGVEVHRTHRVETVQRLWAAAAHADDPARLITIPGVEWFPRIGRREEAKKVKTVRLEHGNSPLITTGLYAFPGEVIQIKVEPLGNISDRGTQRQKRIYQVWCAQVGVHTDLLWGPMVNPGEVLIGDQLKQRSHKLLRWGSVTTSRFLIPFVESGHMYDLPDLPEFKDGFNQIASPFGGLLVLHAPGETQSEARITIRGAHRAPFYELRKGQHLPDGPTGVPWGYIRGEHSIHFLPAETVTAAKKHRQIALYWDKAAVAAAEFVGLDEEDAPTQVFVPDIQISVGYMHSGTPIMTHLDVAEIGTFDERIGTSCGEARGLDHDLLREQSDTPLVVNLKKLRKDGSWGHFHEIGHNLQGRICTFKGTGEVTNNLITLWLMQELCGVEDPMKHPWFGEDILDEAYDHAELVYWEEKLAASWEHSVGLLFFVQIADLLPSGLSGIRRANLNILKEVEALSRLEVRRTHPKLEAEAVATLAARDPWNLAFRAHRRDLDIPQAEYDPDDWKQDLWYRHLSREANRDLLPHFKIFGVKVSDMAAQEIAKIPYTPWSHKSFDPLFDWDEHLPEIEELMWEVAKPRGWAWLRAFHARKGGDPTKPRQDRIDHLYRSVSEAAGENLEKLFELYNFEPSYEAVEKVHKLLKKQAANRKR